MERSKDALVFRADAIEEDYELDKKAVLGTGGYGAVFECIHKKTKVHRACKRIAKKSVKNWAAFEREVSIQNALTHPNVCRLYDVYKDAKMYYIVLEICSGGDMFDRITGSKYGDVFTEKTVAHLAKQMLAGVHYCHDQGVAHRDLKPENYLLASKHNVMESPLKLTDFGASTRFTPGEPMVSKVVTPYYVSPDVLSGKYTEACDVWSLGVIFYILMCGQPPFFGNSDRDIMNSVKKGVYKFERDLWKSYSKDVQSFISSMLVMDPSKRTTIAELQHHPWVTRNVVEQEAPLTSSVLGNLRSFRSRDKLQKSILTVLAKYVDEQGVKELQDMFMSMDKDGNGTLTYEEVKKGMQTAGVELGPDIDDLLAGLDADGSGEIDYSEFLAAAMGKRSYEQYEMLWPVFKQFDRQGKGVITKDDLAVILSGGSCKSFEQAVGLEKDEIQKIMGKHDTDGSGDIDFDEFMALIKDAGGFMRGTTMRVGADLDGLAAGFAKSNIR